MPFIELGNPAEGNQRQYFYAEAGHGDPLILFHGFTGAHTSWLPFIEEWAKECHVIAIDLPGHGRTGVPNALDYYTMEQIARDLSQWMELNHLAPIHLLGYSMGGRFALYFATAYPDLVQSIILESASPGLKTAEEQAERKQRDDGLADQIESKGIEWFVDFWESLSLWDSQKQLPESLRQQLRQQRLSNHPGGLAHSLRGMGTGVMPNLWDQISRLDVPVQLIVGAEDKKFVGINQSMMSIIPKANFTLIEGAGHTVHLEKPNLFSNQVLQFLQSH